MFLDIGFGIIISVVVSKITGHPPNNVFIFLCIGFSLLPDIDVFPELLRRGKLGGKILDLHRELTHYPLLYAVIAPIIFYLFGLSIASAFVLCLLVHFIHDSMGGGWGIQWLYPFNKNYFKFFSNQQGSYTWSIAKWNPQQLRVAMQTHGNDNWFKDMYLNIKSPILIIETSVLIASILILFHYI